MIICTNCGHTNPAGAIQCEACYAELPKMSTCPSCQAEVPEDALFCSQCGATLQKGVDLATAPTNVVPMVDPLAATNLVTGAASAGSQIPPTDIVIPSPGPTLNPSGPDEVDHPDELAGLELMPTVMPSAPASEPSVAPSPPDSDQLLSASTDENTDFSQESAQPPVEVTTFDLDQPTPVAPPAVTPAVAPGMTQLQQPMAQLVHVRSNTDLDLPTHLNVIHIGKPNDRIPPDIDVSGFPDSDVVSRVHADIRVEADGYYLEDVGSSNGTYVNNRSLHPGDRYRLRTGDRIALGKEDKVSFIFQSQ